MRTEFIHCKALVNVREQYHLLRGAELSVLPQLPDAWLAVEDGRIADYGPMSTYQPVAGATVVEGRDRYLLPAWCDSHTHLVFAASREEDFVDKIRGMS